MAVPSVKAGTTAEETIQCWCIVGERHKPQIIIYSPSLVTMHSVHARDYTNTLPENEVWNSLPKKETHLLKGTSKSIGKLTKQQLKIIINSSSITRTATVTFSSRVRMVD